jgi:cytochrome c biogenesis protein CcdA
VLQFVLAYAAGLLTLINPCVLPLLPLIAAGSLARHPAGPLVLAFGLMATFILAGIGVYWLTALTGLVADDVSVVAGWIMMGLGFALLLPPAQVGVARVTGPVAAGSTRLIGRFEGKGLGGEMAAGALLGLAWSPCIGPTLGAAIGFAAEGRNLGAAAGIMAAFAAGAATIVLALSYGARGIIALRREALARLAFYARPVLALGLVATGAFIAFHVDHLVERFALQHLPPWVVDLSVSL